MSHRSDLTTAIRLAGVRITDERRRPADPGYLPKVPPLYLSKPTGRQAIRLCRDLRDRVSHERYVPTAAYVTLAPKRSGGKRKVEILTAEDRIAYEALVRSTGRLVGAALCAPSVVFGPRGLSSGLRWSSFIQSPLRLPGSYVVTADVAAFASSVSHDRIRELLLRIGADGRIAAGIAAFLDAVMAADRGVPVDMSASYCLGTAFLSDVDRDMTAQGWRYTRCSDDFRITVDSESEAHEAVARLTASLARIGLSLRPAGARIVIKAEYRQALTLGASDRIWERLSQWNDGHALYSAPLTRVRVASRRARATRGSRAAAARVLVSAAHAPPGGPEPIVRPALELLTAARDPCLLGYVEQVVARCPSETPMIGRYLRSLQSTAAADAALAAIARLLSADLLPAQHAWLYRALLPAAGSIEGAVAAQAVDAAVGPGRDWVLRTEATRVLFARADAPRDVLAALADEAPPQFAHELREMTHGRGLALGC